MSVALKALLAFQKRNSRSLKDLPLQDALFQQLNQLERLVDRIGPTPLRHKLSELLVQMRTEIWAFDQSKE